MDVESLKKMNKSKNKKLVKKYYAFLASVAIIKQIPCLLGLGLSKAGKCSILSYVSYLCFSRVDLVLTSCGEELELSSVLAGYCTCSCSPASSLPPCCSMADVYVGAPEIVDAAMWYLYAPDLKAWWGIHVKLFAFRRPRHRHSGVHRHQHPKVTPFW
jgi:hypothetical protein